MTDKKKFEKAFLLQFSVSFIKISGSIRSKGGEVISSKDNSGHNPLFQFEQRWRPFTRTITDKGNWEAFLFQFSVSFIRNSGSIQSKDGEVISLKDNSRQNLLFEQTWRPFTRTMTDKKKIGWLSRSGSHLLVSFVNHLALALINTSSVLSSLVLISLLQITEHSTLEHTSPVLSSLLLISLLQDLSASHRTLSDNSLNISNNTANRG